MQRPNKLAFSTHEYGPYVFAGQWFYKAKNFPWNMFPIYRWKWGFAQQSNIAPVWVGLRQFLPARKPMEEPVQRMAFRVLFGT